MHLATSEITRQGRLLRRIDRETIVMLNVHPSACVGALIACERGHPFRGVYGEGEEETRLLIEVGHKLDKEREGIEVWRENK